MKKLLAVTIIVLALSQFFGKSSYAACVFPLSGDVTISTSCGVNGVDGVDGGTNASNSAKITIANPSTLVTLTINADSTLVFGSVVLGSNAAIAINISQAELLKGVPY